MPHHGRSQASLLIEPIVRFSRQICDRILCEEVRPDALLRGLVGHGLGAVLAKLKSLPVLVGTRPCTTLAVEPRDFVDLQESFSRSNRTHFTNAVEHGV